MKIYNKPVVVYDIECFSNLLVCVLYNTESKKLASYEISNRKNDIGKIVNLFKLDMFYFCGYNSKFYDDPLINYIIMDYDNLYNKSSFEQNYLIKNVSNLIIEKPIEYWSTYKHANIFRSFDLMSMSFSKKNRCGLKELEVTMNFENVEEFQGDFNKPVHNDKIDEVIQYCINDVLATNRLLELKEEDIQLRLDVGKTYKINVLSKDNVNMGMNILKKAYLDKTNKQWDDIKNLRSPCEIIDFNEVILPFIHYSSPELQKLLVELKNTKIKPDDDFEKHFIFGGIEHSFSKGGLHSINKPEIIIPKENQILRSDDCTSMYPSFLINFDLYPKHLGHEFTEVLSDLTQERIKCKKENNKLRAEALKYAINGISGNLQYQNSWIYDPFLVFKLRINCQLLMLLLVEKLINIGARIIQENTDGVEYLIDKSLIDKVEKIKNEWCKLTKFTLETETYERFYQYSVNDYIGVKSGYSETKDRNLIKLKGLFNEETILGKGMSPKIIAKAINEYFINGVSPDHTLENCKDISMFVTYQKVSSDFIVEYNNEKVSHINRFYMSKDGGRLIKYKIEKGGKAKATMICASSLITIYNKFDNIPFEKRNINFRYYKNEIYKIINSLEIEQLNLF